MLLRLVITALLITPPPLTAQPMRVAISIDATGMTVARIQPEPFCATASNALTDALEAEGLQSYGVNARTTREAAAAVHHYFDTDTAPDPSDYPPAGNC